MTIISPFTFSLNAPVKIGIAIFCVLFGAFAATPVFGTVYTWTGAADGTNFVNAGNWNPNGVPSGGDTGLWNGVVAGNLLVNYGGQVSGSGTSGVFLEFGSSQAGSVEVYFAGPGSSTALNLYSIQNLSPASPFILGDDSTNNLLVTMRPAGAIHPLFNNSTATCVINPSVTFEAGGGNGFVYDFSGTGNWVVNNYLMPDNGTFTPMTVQVDGPGTLFWGQGVPNDSHPPNSTLGTIIITGGALVMTSAFPLNSGQMINTAISNTTSVTYSPAPSTDPTLTNDTWDGVISGAGNLIINGGTLTLGGASTYTGNTILSNGEVIVDGLEEVTNGPLGAGNTISFDGGTLGFSVSNTFDYSPRFDPSPNQAYSVDTAGQSVTFATGLTSSGATLTKLGSGTLTLSGANTYSGATIVNAGKLVFQGSMTGSGDISVADGAALGVTAGSEVTPGRLTVGTSAGTTLEFNNVSSTTTALIAAGTFFSAGIAGAITINVNVNSSTLVIGESYPLLSWSSGVAPAVSPGVLNGAGGYLSIKGNVLYLNVTSLASPTLNFTPNGNTLLLSWTGSFKLQAQTNGLTGTWVDYPGGGTSPVTITIDPANESVFFRLAPGPQLISLSR